jgi:soluble lytic murein transglycosylase-like protein/outer membrane protein assembly factor BamD (BamD/ComL family)
MSLGPFVPSTQKAQNAMKKLFVCFSALMGFLGTAHGGIPSPGPKRVLPSIQHLPSLSLTSTRPRLLARQTNRPSTTDKQLLWPGHDFPLKPYFFWLPHIPKGTQQKAQKRWRKGQTKKAIALLVKASKSLPATKRYQAQLAIAHQAMGFADARHALPLYRTLIKRAPRAIAYEARLFAARHALMQYSPRTAFLLLATWPSRAPSTNRDIWLAGWLLRSVAAVRVRQYKQANRGYNLLRRTPSPLRNVAAYLSLRLLLKQKKSKTLLKRARRFLKMYPTSRYRSSVMQTIARGLEKQGKWKRALQMYNKLYQAGNRTQATLGKARCWIRLNRHKQARVALESLLRKQAGKWSAHAAYRMLKRYPSSHKRPSFAHAVAYHLYRRGRLKQSVSHFDRQIKHITRQLKRAKKKSKRTRLNKYFAKALLYKGKVSFRLKQYKPATKALRTLLKRFPKTRSRKEAELLLIRCRYRVKKDLPTVARYLAYAERYKGNWRGRRALWWSAQLTSEHGQTARAMALFRRFIKRYPRARRTAEARIKIALVAYQGKQYKQTIRQLRGLSRWGGRTGARALFWVGKAYEQLGKKRQALRAFRKISKYADAYYAARAKERFSRRRTLARKHVSLYDLLPGPKEIARHKLLMTKWLAKRYRQKASSLVRKMKELSAYKRARLFALAGLSRLLRSEMRQLQRRAKHPFQWYLQACLWKAYGNPNRTLYMGGRFRSKVPRSKRKGMPFKAVLRVLYPLPFPAIYMQYGKKYNMRPLLMVGLTRQESLFNPTIVSHANARGIAQIMPKEGRKLAKKWKLRGYRLQHLFRPQLNLRMGFVHFRDYLTKNNGHVPLTLASYNAGPGPLKRWKKAAPGLAKRDLEAFIEYGIGFRETRQYVRYCLRWYNMYRFAFAGGKR